MHALRTFLLQHARFSEFDISQCQGCGCGIGQAHPQRRVKGYQGILQDGRKWNSEPREGVLFTL